MVRSREKRPKDCTAEHDRVTITFMGTDTLNREWYQCPTCGRAVLRTAGLLVGGPRWRVIQEEEGDESSGTSEGSGPIAADAEDDERGDEIADPGAESRSPPAHRQGE